MQEKQNEHTETKVKATIRITHKQAAASSPWQQIQIIARKISAFPPAVEAFGKLNLMKLYCVQPFWETSHKLHW